MTKPRVLIVEDDKLSRTRYEKLLPDEFFEKQFAMDGEEALSAYNKWNPNFIILDIMIPGISGYNVLKTIRQEIHDTKTAVIMVTSKSDQSDVMDCMKLGVQGYLIKPLNTHVLIKLKKLIMDLWATTEQPSGSVQTT
ncbi:MAG: response regulator [Deltaproteobacteria bacterium]|nr:response regulator [Deltaproteobacteria bacterium]